MTSADLQWSEVDVPVGALDESTDPRLLPPGQLISAVNCEFTTKEGSLRKRPGLLKISEPPQDGAAANLPLSRLIVHETHNQLLAVDLKGNSVASPGLYSIPGNTSLRPKHVGGVTPFLLRRKPITTDLQSDVTADCAYVDTVGPFGYMVYGTCHFQTGRINVKVVKVDKSTDTYETAETVYDNDFSYNIGGLGKAFFVRAAAALDRYVLITWQHSLGGISGVKVDCGTSTPSVTVGSLTSILTSKDSTLFSAVYYHDLCESTKSDDIAGAPNWLLAYHSHVSSGSAVDLRLARVNTSLGTHYDVNAGAGEDPSGISVFEIGNNTYINYYNDATGKWRYVVRRTSDGGSILTNTDWCTAADTSAAQISGNARCSAIGLTETNTEVILFHSQGYENAASGTSGLVVRWSPMTRWRRVRTNASMDGLRQKYGVRLWSKPCRDRVSGKWLAWCGAMSAIEQSSPGISTGTTGSTIRWTGCLMRFAETAASEDLFNAQLVGSSGGLILGDVYTTTSASATPPSAMTPSSITHPITDMTAGDVPESLGRRCVLNYCYIPTERKSGPWEVTFRDNENDSFVEGYGRYQSARMGGSVYCAGGLLSQWDGSRLVENNFVKAPWLNVKVVTGGTAWGSNWAKWAQQKLFLQAVYETVFENGERVRSATSQVVSVTLNGTFDVSAPDQTITLYAEPHTLSLKTYGAVRTPKTVVTIYGSAEPNGQTLYRWFPYEVNMAVPATDSWSWSTSDPDTLAPHTYTINGTTDPYNNTGTYNPSSTGVIAEMQKHEIIYNDSGELDNDHPWGGCSCLASHKDRLWVGGGDEPDLIWYSKKHVDGRPMEFALGQQVRLPSSPVVALASHGDALIVFCRHSIYAIYGDGPNATGDDNSGFFTVVPVSTTVGCNSSASVISTPEGIMFRSEVGVYLLNHGRQLESRGQVQDLIATTRSPVASQVVPHYQQARLILNYGGGENPALSDALVYDWEAKKWAVWRYTWGTSLFVKDMKYLGDKVYVLRDDGRVYVEDSNTFADDGTAYRQSVTWGWLNFGRINGYKRLHKMHMLMQPYVWASYTNDPSAFPFGLRAVLDLKWANSGYAIDRRWSNYELGQTAATDGINMLGLHIGKTAPSVRVTLEEDSPVLRITGTNTDATVSTVGATVLKAKIDAAAGFSTLTVTSGASRTKAQVAADLTSQIAVLGWTDYLRAYVNGSSQIVLETIKKDAATGPGSYLAVDSVANGSTLNTPLGFNVAGEVGTATVSVSSQTGFVVQALSFEVGHARGSWRNPALQSR